ncbi:MAG: hypothetical protein NZ553_19510, partial [Caldilinea sp.]|nr:hypothetical protein [Caldilinea sp.]MDW8442671.1 hypothetical protein [Caldilineaceae bacterium]
EVTYENVASLHASPLSHVQSFILFTPNAIIQGIMSFGVIVGFDFRSSPPALLVGTRCGRSDRLHVCAFYNAD